MRLATMSDAALLIVQMRRRSAARRLAKLVQSGAVFADDYRALTECCGDDQVIETALTLALRARGLRDVARADNTVRGIVGFHESGRWSARAGGVASETEQFNSGPDAIEWLDEKVEEHLRDSIHEGDYYLQIGIVEYGLTCTAELPHDEAGFCEVCWAVEQTSRADTDLNRKALDEVAVNGSMMGTRGVS